MFLHPSPFIDITFLMAFSGEISQVVCVVTDPVSHITSNQAHFRLSNLTLLTESLLHIFGMDLAPRWAVRHCLCRCKSSFQSNKKTPILSSSDDKLLA